MRPHISMAPALSPKLLFDIIQIFTHYTIWLEADR